MKKLTFVAIAAFAFFSATAQEETSMRTTTRTTAQVAPVEAVQEEKIPTTLSEQFQYMVDRSNSYERFKLIDKTKLATFQRSMNDSINSVKSRLEAEKQTVKTHENTIKTLNDNITELQTALDETKNQKDSMNFFGALLSKGLYNTIMWGIVVVLTVLLVFYIYRYANGNVVTKKSISDLAELQEEYENYRKAAIEREQKVRRQLQDEINKHR